MAKDPSADTRTKSELADVRLKLAAEYQEYAKTWDPKKEILEWARAGDLLATDRCDELFENWRTK